MWREVDAVVGHAQVGHGHVEEEDERDEAGGDARGEEYASGKFDSGDNEGGRAGRGEIEGGEELGDAGEVGELAPSILRELAAPVEADGEQQAGLRFAAREAEFVAGKANEAIDFGIF